MKARTGIPGGAQTAMVEPAGIELADKVAALSCAEIYGEPDGAISAIETHMSWVFLTARYAYKLKKPVRYPFLDFSTLSAREHYCREELRLNRRLAPTVYLELVPLRSRNGTLLLGQGEGKIVDYLVKMIRLPFERMFDRVVSERKLRRSDVRALAITLTNFYRTTKKATITPIQYCSQLAAAVVDNRTQLSLPRYRLPHDIVTRIAAAQLDYVVSSDALALRAAHVVDAHGDLRPEHICLCEPLQIIDCLEFGAHLRQLDPFDELAFLAIECERLGAPRTGTMLVRLYGILSGDHVAPGVIAFYRSHRAMIRAVLAIWHLDDPAVREYELWRQRALTYIGIAERAIKRARSAPPALQLG